MDSSIVIALPNAANVRQIRELLQRYGMRVAAVSTTGARALSAMSGLCQGVLICGFHFKDMFYRDILEDMPEDFEMVLVASARVLAEAPSGLVCVELPFQARDLVDTVQMVIRAQERRQKKKGSPPGPRTREELAQIQKAKDLLMDRNHMTEEEAHRYLLKTSMDTGTSLVETAQMIQMLL